MVRRWREHSKQVRAVLPNQRLRLPCGATRTRLRRITLWVRCDRLTTSNGISRLPRAPLTSAARGLALTPCPHSLASQCASAFLDPLPSLLPGPRLPPSSPVSPSPPSFLHPPHPRQRPTPPLCVRGLRLPAPCLRPSPPRTLSRSDERLDLTGGDGRSWQWAADADGAFWWATRGAVSLFMRDWGRGVGWGERGWEVGEGLRGVGGRLRWGGSRWGGGLRYWL